MLLIDLSTGFWAWRGCLSEWLVCGNLKYAIFETPQTLDLRRACDMYGRIPVLNSERHMI
jgi:hypothetical protein